MRKILYIFALVIGVLLNASADVYRLKVKDELAQKDEFWVENGTPTETQTDRGRHFARRNLRLQTLGNYERTERQLMFSMLHGSSNLTESDNSQLQFSTRQKTEPTIVVPSKNDLFFVWTKGNPVYNCR